MIFGQFWWASNCDSTISTIKQLSNTTERVNNEKCKCRDEEFPPWTNEIHGLSQALMSNDPRLRLFWWIVLFICTAAGTGTTVLVIKEYLQGQTATSTTIKLVSSLALPSVTICPKVSDSFQSDAIYADIHEMIPGLDNNTATDVIRFFLGGSGLENISKLKSFNRTYMDTLNQLYLKWKGNYDRKEFFDIVFVSCKFRYFIFLESL